MTHLGADHDVERWHGLITNPLIGVLVLALALSQPRPVHADAGDCLQPATVGATATATDCLFVLQAATGSRTCSNPCICDADGNGVVLSSDALQCLSYVTGISDEPLCTRCEVPLPPLVVATRTSSFVPDDPYEYCPDYCPERVAFSIFLAADGTGWVSVEEAFIHAVVVAVSWQATAAGIAISSHEVRDEIRPGYYAGVGWRDMVLDVTPDTPAAIARGAIPNTGTATATVIWDFEVALFDEGFETEVTFDLAPDDTAPSLSLAKSDGYGPVLVTGDRVFVHSSRPLLRAGLEDEVTLAVGGLTQAGTVTARGLNGPFATHLVIAPSDPLPFASSVAADPGGATDAFGRTPVGGAGLTTMADPGPITTNPGFEGTGGWSGLYATTSWSPFDPMEGSELAVVFSDLVGYLDVPQGATTLRFWAGILEYLDCASVGAGVTIYTSAGSWSVFPDGTAPEFCNDAIFGECIPWTEVSFDLTPYQGERIAVRATSSEYTECAPDLYEDLVLDDFRVE